MKVLAVGDEADLLGFGLAGIRAGTVEEADEETVLFVSHGVDVGDTKAMIVRLPPLHARGEDPDRTAS